VVQGGGGVPTHTPRSYWKTHGPLYGLSYSLARLSSKKIHELLRHAQHRHMPTAQSSSLHRPFCRRNHALLHMGQYTFIQFAHQVGGGNVAPRSIFQRGCKSCEIGVGGVWGPVGCDVCGCVVMESRNGIVGVDIATLARPVE